MLRLYILRHAKAAVATPGMKDQDRGLTERGNDDAKRLANSMRQLQMLPGEVVCSPSRRTRMTLHAIMGAFDDAKAPQIEYDENLYSGEPADYWKAIHGFVNEKPAMIIGHNPMCEIVAAAIGGEGEPTSVSLLRKSFPAGALAVFDLPAKRWAEVRQGEGWLVNFIVPAG